MREIIFAKAISLLKQKGFLISTYLHLNNCFDVAAKKGTQVILVKILANIDALREEQADELKRIGTVFGAAVFVLGERSKAFGLGSETIYERYGIPCITTETFKNILEDRMPSMRYFKGKKLVEIDSEKLRKKRHEKGLSLQEIADKIKSTPESIHRYETTGSTSLETADRLEAVFGEKFVRKIDVLKPSTEEKELSHTANEEVFEKIKKLGLDLEFFSHAPFEAFSHPSESIYFQQAKRKNELSKKANDLLLTQKIVGGLPLIIAKESEKENIGSVPVIREEEIFSMSRKKNLLELATERQKNGKRKKF